MAARVGYCGLDRTRAPLVGDEVKACWEDGLQAFPVEPAAIGLGLLDAPPLEPPSPTPYRPAGPAFVVVEATPNRIAWVDAEGG